MCLIIAAPNGGAPDMEQVMAGWRDNPDSWGIMAAHKRRLTIRRGLCTESLLAAIADIGESPWAIHFRWATHGRTDLSNAHPFKITRSLYMMHNGVIDIDCTADPLRSDTYHYSRYLQDIGVKPDNINAAEREQEIGRGNKLVFLDNTGRLTIANERAGEWIDGHWYSNTHSMHRAKFKWGRIWSPPNELPNDSAAPNDDADWDYCDYCGAVENLTLTDNLDRLCGDCITWEGAHERYEKYFAHHR